MTQLENLTWDPEKRAATVTTGQLNLSAGLGATGISPAVHDVTAHSNGVLADVRAGRLKRDLSTLLSRPIEELEDKPLYVADGRMNHFQIGADGSFTNGSSILTSQNSDYLNNPTSSMDLSASS